MVIKVRLVVVVQMRFKLELPTALLGYSIHLIKAAQKYFVKSSQIISLRDSCSDLITCSQKSYQWLVC